MAEREAKDGRVETGLKLTLNELQRRLRDFQQEYLKNKSPETVGTYRRALHEFERWFATQRGQFRFRVADVQRYKQYLMREKKLHQVSVSTYLTALRRFCSTWWTSGCFQKIPPVQSRAIDGRRAIPVRCSRAWRSNNCWPCWIRTPRRLACAIGPLCT
ncbi:site-specific integrase [Rhodothermus marinus]|uniref:site-specific integrase n=1 Tax=Rhodothermus marinus TaxID=29549 RepID=UPI000AC10DC5|nr:site-specific integrase [Rhodothermus marinus]